MPPHGPPAATPPPALPDALRVVLFGLPAAGKSSLLGALAQSARSQENLLNGRLNDLSHGLDELRRRLYEDDGRQTAEEVTPYAVDYEPFTADGRAPSAHEHLGAVFIDCDGRVANDLLARHESLAEDSPEGTLAREVVRADTLVLVVDAADPPARVEADFAAFGRFLRLLEQDRGDRTEVGGLPVFLVLTKCDLLARPGDSVGAWMERIEERKRDVDARFRDFLARRTAEDGRPPFGRLDLHLWATAVKRPALGRTPAKAQEPYGVAELFRQCLEEAASFRDRTRRSGRRLVWTAGGVGGAVAAILAAMIGLVSTNRETPAGDLRARVEDVRALEGSTPAERLRGTPGDLRRRLAAFTALRDDPSFGSLPSRDRDYVLGRIAELEEYTAYYEKLQAVTRPGDVPASDKLREIAGELQALAPPRPEWADTDAARLRAERLAEAEGLARAVARARGWYDDSMEKGRDLWVFARYGPTAEAPAINWRGWYDEAARLLDPARAPPFHVNEPVPGTHLTYGTALRFDRVLEARADWDALKGKLERVLDVAAALGLVGDVKGRPAVLFIPRPPEFPLDRAGTRLKELRQAYPRYKSEFVLAGLPDAILPEVRQAARANYDYLLEPGRETVRRRLRAVGGDEEDTPARWAQVGAWLAAGPPELAAWRELALVLARLQDPDAADPVTALAGFLQKTGFPIEVRQVTLEVPFRHADVKPQAGADFAIHHPATVAEGPAVACPPTAEGERDDARKVTVYRFRPRERPRLTFHPGEALWAALPLRDGRQLTWTDSRSAVYPFECLHRPPRLRGADEPNGEGAVVDDIRLLVIPTDGVPRVPDLMPAVRAGK